MSELVSHTQEIADSPPLGHGYERFESPNGYMVGVPTFRTPNKLIYLVPVEPGDENRWAERVDVLRFNDVPCHLLPSGEDQYTSAESVFATETLGQPAREVRTPLMPRQNEKEALVFDPRSAKSVLDVMIACGQDTRKIRELRRTALHGESNPEVDILEDLLEFGRAFETDRGKADTLRTVYGIDNYTGTSDVVYSLIDKGLDAFPYQRIEQRKAEGVNLELIKEAVDAPERLRALIADGWEQAIEAAKVHNSDLHTKGIYTELHKVGGVVVALPALTSTAWEKSGSTVGYVDVTGAGHTLTGLYRDYSSKNAQNTDVTGSLINAAPIIQLSRELGVLANGPATLQRRCLTTFDADGNPVIHLQDKDHYNNRLGKMSNEQIWYSLTTEGIQSDLVTSDAVHIDIGHEANNKPVSVRIREIEELDKPRIKDEIPIAYVTRVFDNSDETNVTWSVGYADNHDKLLQEVTGNSEVEPGIKIRFGNDQMLLRATYIGYEDAASVKQQAVLWHFYGSPKPFELYADKIKAIVDNANEALAVHMEAKWGADQNKLSSKIWFTNSATNEGLEVLL